MQIISASRRTDIPAFYMQWFMIRVEEGFAYYPNPFGMTLQRVSLLPTDVHSIVFWSKHYGPLLANLGKLLDKGYCMCFHYTINNAPRLLEPHSPPWELSVKIFGELALATSPKQVFWRFDPIVLTKELDHRFYLNRFREIGSKLQGLTERCYFSFVNLYGKTKSKMLKKGISWIQPSLQEKRELAGAMAELARDWGMKLLACCQEDLLGDGIQGARCIDGELLSELFPDKPPALDPGSTRPGCGCSKSRDIGMYDTCPMGCVYCYAYQSRQQALNHFKKHDPMGWTLVDMYRGNQRVPQHVTLK
ncbi:MAG: DUF1848 domain-containing protein [bacterium]